MAQRGMPMGMPMRPMYRMPDYRRGGGAGGEAGGFPEPPRQAKGFRGPSGGRRGGARMGMQQAQQMPPNMGMVPPGGPMDGSQPYPGPMADQAGADVAARQGAASGGLIDTTQLASASPEEQKTLLGEALYPQIMQRQPELAGKITGMILELDNTEILHLLESPEALNEKVQEAIKVLNDYNAQVKDTSE